MAKTMKVESKKAVKKVVAPSEAKESLKLMKVCYAKGVYRNVVRYTKGDISQDLVKSRGEDYMLYSSVLVKGMELKATSNAVKEKRPYRYLVSKDTLIKGGLGQLVKALEA